MSVFMSHSAVGGGDPSSAALHLCLDEFAKLPKVPAETVTYPSQLQETLGLSPQEVSLELGS